jgi:parallel beta-helix repeat protein
MASRTWNRTWTRRRFAFPLLRLEDRITPVADVGNTILAAQGALVSGFGAGSFAVTDYLGDGAYPDRDVDMFKIQAAPGYRITTVTSQPGAGPKMDTVLRLFDATGTELVSNDDYLPNTGGTSRLSYTVQTGLYFYVGLSGYRNINYDPNAEGTGTDNTVGAGDAAKGNVILSIAVVGNGNTWVSQGPDYIANGQTEGITGPPANPVVGAVTAAVVDPGNPNRMWVATVNGGVFRTLNANNPGGPNWVALTDDQQSLSIQSLSVDPTDTNTLIAGLGRPSSFGGDGGDMNGLLRSTDGGDTWVSIGGRTNGIAGPFSGDNVNGAAERGSVILVGAGNRNFYALGGAHQGIWRSTDSGNTFVQIPNDTMGNAIGGVFDLAGDPGNPARFYLASSTGVYRSEDTGMTWVNITGALAAALVPAPAVGAGVRGGMRIAVENRWNNDGAGTNVVWVISNRTGVANATVFQSKNRGGAWRAMGGVAVNPGGQAALHLSIAADAANDDAVYVGGDRQPSNPNVANGTANWSGNLFRGDATKAAGAAGEWTSITGNNAQSAAPTNTSPHADSRQLVFIAGRGLIDCDDGGIYLRTNPTANAPWSSLIGTGLRDTEMYSTAYDPVNQRFVSGEQDNGAAEQGTLGGGDWNQLVGVGPPAGPAFIQGDGGRVVVQDEGAGGVWRYGSSQFYGNLQAQQYNANNATVGAAQSVTLTINPAPGAGFYPNIAGGQFNELFAANTLSPAAGAQNLAFAGALWPRQVPALGFPQVAAAQNYHIYTSTNRGANVTQLPEGAGVNLGTIQLRYTGNNKFSVQRFANNSPAALTVGGRTLTGGAAMNVNQPEPNALLVGNANGLFYNDLVGAAPAAPIGTLQAVAGFPAAANGVRALAPDPREWKTVYFIGGNNHVYRATTINGGVAAPSYIDLTADNLAAMPPVRYTGGLGTDPLATGLWDIAGRIRSIQFIPSANAMGADGVVIVSADRGTFAMQTVAPGVWTKIGYKLPNTPGTTLLYSNSGGRELLGLGTFGRGAWSLDAPSGVFDMVQPIAVLINPGQPATNNGLVTFNVTFNENVIGVSKDSFTANLTGAGAVANSASVVSVSGQGTAYIVTVDSGSGGNNLRLRLKANSGITDVAGNPLGSSLVNISYTINRTLPTASVTLPAITVGGKAYQFVVTYDGVTGPIDGTTIKTGNVLVAGPGFNATPTLQISFPIPFTNRRIAYYQFTPPNGRWTTTVNGDYTVTATNVAADQVKNNGGTPLPANQLGTLSVDIPKLWVINVSDAKWNAAGNPPAGFSDKDTNLVLTPAALAKLTLRSAVSFANANLGIVDTIAFNPTQFGTAQTITLSSQTRLNINDSVTINGILGSKTPNVTIDGGNNTRIFYVSGFKNQPALSVTLDSLTLTHGKNVNASGGAVFNLGNSVTIVNSVLTGNQAYTGGAIASVGYGNYPGTLAIRNCAITGNTALGGGAINMNGGTFTIEGCTLSGNNATGNPTTTGDGGAIRFLNTAAGNQLVLRNSTISGNTAKTRGGGLYLGQFAGNLLIQNSTITKNTAGNAYFGGGISFKDSPMGTLTLQSSLVAKNICPTYPDVSALFAKSVIASNSAIGSQNGIKAADQTAYTNNATNIPFGTNLKLDPTLADNGSPAPVRQSHLPQTGSTLLQSGANPANLTFDQRGPIFPRQIAGFSPDIGAVEFQSDGTIRGRVFEDRDGNLTFSNPPDVALAGRIVFLDTNNNGILNPGELTATTDANGLYQFTGQANGAYNVRTVVPQGWTLLAPPGGKYTVTLPPSAAGCDFPEARSGTISGLVYNDVNRNGKRDLQTNGQIEPGLGNQQVFLDLNRNGAFVPYDISSADVPKGIPDNVAAGVTSAITVSGWDATVNVFDINVTLNITHPRDSDLRVTLTGPTGVQRVLFSGVGGAGANFTETTLDDQSATAIDAGAAPSVAPFTGRFKLAGAVTLAGFNGQNPNGVWTLTVSDTAAGLTGALTSWRLQFNDSSTKTDAQGRYVFNNVPAGGYRVRYQAALGHIITQPAGPLLQIVASYPVTLAMNGASSAGNNFGDFAVPLPPLIINIQRYLTFDPNPGPGERFLVQFNEPVTAPTPGDFMLDNTGTAIGTIASVTAIGSAGDTYEVDIAGVSGTGTLALDMVSSVGVTDNLSQPVSDLPYDGESYTISNYDPPPEVQTIQATGDQPDYTPTADFTVTFSEPVSAPAAGNFTLVTDGTATGMISSVTGGPDVYTVHVTGLSGNGTLRLDMTDSTGVVDSASQPLDNLTFYGDTYTVLDDPPPLITSIDRASADPVNPTMTSMVSYNVSFSEAVSGLSAANFIVSTTGSATGMVTSVSGGPSLYTVTVSGLSGPGGLRLDMTDSTGVNGPTSQPVVNVPFTGATYSLLGPSVYVVDETSDIADGDFSPGHLSLREAIGLANANPFADTITFDPNVFAATTIIVVNSEMAVSDGLTIQGPAARLTLDGNTVSRLFNVTAPAGQLVTLDDLSLTNAYASGNGAAIADGAADLTLTNCTVSNSKSDAAGGGIATGSGTLTVIGSTISGNSAGTAGGGLYLAGSTAVIRNSTVSGNSASLGGGVTQFGGTTTIQNTTIAFNNATSSGGGIKVGAGSVSIESTIVGNDTAPTGPDVSGAVTANYSLLSNSSGAAITGGSNKLNVNPLLQPLANNGGPTATHKLGIGSPGVDAGSNPAVLITDQRGAGFPRQVGPALDIGSFEGVSSTPVAIFNGFGPVLALGSTPDSFTVTYTDDNAINVGTIDVNDIKIVGPFSNTLTILSVSVDNPTDGTPRTATYKFAVPGGSWDAADNGIYTVSMVGFQVFDGDASPSHSIAAGTLGTFTVATPRSLLVTNANDSGLGSLRQAVLTANASPGHDTIVFDTAGVFSSPQTIMLLSTLTISDGVTIQGPAARVTLDGNNATQLLDITAPFGNAVTLDSFTLTKANAVDDGGAIFLDAAALTVTNCTITNNASAGAGGGIDVGDGGGTLTIATSTISGNTAAGNGAGINIEDSGALTMDGSTVSGNVAGGAGGGLCGYGSLALIRNSTISGNSAAIGGGLAQYGGSASFESCTIAYNSAGDSGGGIDATSGGGDVDDFGSDDSAVSLESTIVGKNTAPTGPDVNGPISADFSLLSNSSGADIVDGANNKLDVDPFLGPLANYGGPTLTISLLSGSPAINGGDNADGFAFDQRGPGFPRVVGGQADIGAFEVQTAPPPTVTSLKIDDGTAQRSMIRSLTITFSEPVTFSGAITSAITLSRLTAINEQPGVTGFVNLVATQSGGGNTVTLLFATGGPNPVDGVADGGFYGKGASLPDGRYTLTIDASQVTGNVSMANLDGDFNSTPGGDYVLASAPSAGGNPPTNIFRYYGDLNGDGAVAANDFAVFRLEYQSANEYLDYNNDGGLGAADFLQFRNRFLQDYP